GRGAMGIVYEAQQISLPRRVALKVLPFAASLDHHRLQRFQNEAHAAGSLQHPHIVPVYAVGCERGVHYIAMQFIDGQHLAARIPELNKGQGAPQAPEVHWPSDAPTVDRCTGETPAFETLPPTDRQADTRPDGLGGEYYRWAAELGIQAAEALEHA